MVTFTEGVLVPGQISLALSRGHSPTVKPVDKTTGVGKAWVRGQIVYLNAAVDKFEVAVADVSSEQYGVATEDAAESDPKGHIAAEGTAVAVTLAGAVVANNRIVPAAAGEGIGADGAETAGMFCGDYLGHAAETDGKTISTNGADNEVVYMLVHRN